MGYSILAGSLTVSIIILPVIIRTTEEALKTVPESYREASLGLGATKFQTLYKVILPSAMPGILSGVILSIGRIIGESAAILLTAGTVAQMPKGIFFKCKNTYSSSLPCNKGKRRYRNSSGSWNSSYSYYTSIKYFS